MITKDGMSRTAGSNALPWSLTVDLQSYLDLISFWHTFWEVHCLL